MWQQICDKRTLLFVYTYCCCCWLDIIQAPGLTNAQVVVSSGQQVTSQLLDCDSSQTLVNVSDVNTSKSSDCIKRRRQHILNLNVTKPINETLFSIDFNNLVRREAPENQTNDCLNGSSPVAADVICLPTKAKKQIEVHIRVLDNSPGKSDADHLNWHEIKLGARETIQCRLNVTAASSELKFKLRWLRNSPDGEGPFRNQSIGSPASSSNSGEQVIISAEIAERRSWTLQRDGGLDLYLHDFRSADAGDYFCQAVSLDSETILDERRIYLSAGELSPEVTHLNSSDNQELESTNDDSHLYSQANLRKLLPSLWVVPEYSEVSLGATVQLACTTSELDDPDPSADLIEWTFEPFDRHNQTKSRSTSAGSLPADTTISDNVLTVWSMSRETVGLYKCGVRLSEFNLSVEAAGELTLRPTVDSAPLVYVAPELLRLSANGTATIQCESTGYPPPQIEWYRVDDNTNATTQLDSLEGVELRRLGSRDSMAHCEQFGCLAVNNARLQGQTGASTPLVTAISLITIERARSHHQGQYVCKSSNKHGQNQASSLVDVEFKEEPQVSIAEGHKLQTIVLPPEESNAKSAPASSRMPNVTFKCSIAAGQPQPRLKWLRTTSGGGGGNKAINLRPKSRDNQLDIYDLTRVSSATSRVSTRLEDAGKTLVLELATLSIDDEGDYVCLAENELGRHSALARLIVRRAARLQILQQSPQIFRSNASFQLDCLASGHPAPLDIEWARSDRGAFFALISHHSSAHQLERAVLKFDRVTADDAGEYTCAARDPLNSTVVLRDTIMLLYEEPEGVASSSELAANSTYLQRQLPKLLIRPTKVTAQVGSNVTLDCLAISGLQPTLVEWLAPALMATESAAPTITDETRSNTLIKPYYRSRTSGGSDHSGGPLLQFGSKLRLFNVSKAHEGVYQCRGRNKVGVENAPALVKVVLASDSTAPSDQKPEVTETGSDHSAQTKTKVAKMGANIELRCQVNGVNEQPATSWSRDGRALPASSVQIEHNLWLRNLTKADEGLYLCSARSSEPNRVIQAKINLLVQDSATLPVSGDHQPYDPASLNARIIASKNSLNLGDSVTLECIISFVGGLRNNSSSEDDRLATSSQSAEPLDELERQVIWTNLHSGHSLFQDNVYIQNNLLIVYNLKRENAATYRCNFNDLTQHTDYKLQLASDSVTSNEADEFHFATSYNRTEHDQKLKVIVQPAGSKLVLSCGGDGQKLNRNYFWTRWSSSADGSAGRRRRRVGREMEPLVWESLDTSDADLYACLVADNETSAGWTPAHLYLVQVQVIAAKFSQRPVSFVSLPAISDSVAHQLELEVKFLPESEHGLLLFSGGVSAGSSSPTSNNNNNNSSSSKTTALASADYISLGLQAGHLEFKFELGDGVTMLRSLEPLELGAWHRALIERNRKGAIMWLDGQAPVSNNSAGKFLNLNLDSLLYVGGHQVFLSHSQTGSALAQPPPRLFHGFSQGFRGCVSSLHINRRPLELMARSRSVAMGLFECDHFECSSWTGSGDHCNNQGHCQVDRTLVAGAGSGESGVDKRRQSQANADLRCICLPAFKGANCNESLTPAQVSATLSSAATSSQIIAKQKSPPTLSSDECSSSQAQHCNSTGTSQCQALSSSSSKCHCKLGYAGEGCDQLVSFTSDTSIRFNQQAYVQLGFNSPGEVMSAIKSMQSANSSTSISTFNETEYARLTSFTDHLNVTFKIQTRSSYAILFYTGSQGGGGGGAGNGSASSRQGVSSQSKSLVVNLLARLGQAARSAASGADYLAIALVDGLVELSYELGSGVAIIRSTRRVNDGAWHKIDAFRWGKSSQLIVDELDRSEIVQSPGRLNALNVAGNDAGGAIYLGGLPRFQQPASSQTQLLSAFSGCLASLQINSLGPMNLLRDDHLSRVRAARNILPCASANAILAEIDGEKITTQTPTTTTTSTTTTTTTTTTSKSLRKLSKPTHAPSESETDDPDELAAAAA